MTTDNQQAPSIFAIDPDTSWPEARELINQRLELIAETDCDCDEDAHNNALHDLAVDDVPTLINVIDQQARRIDAVRALHSSSFDCDAHNGRHCNECGDLAPCATIRALDA